jgi:hypothetical protein
MSGVLAFCAWMTFAYVPWDFLTKPVARDEEVWLGIVLRGWPAKATEPLHWLIYALGTYGFWHMKSWMHPWAAVYTAQIALSMLVWGHLDPRSPGAWSGWLAALPFAALAIALWRHRALFDQR